MPQITVTPEALAQSANVYRSELLAVPAQSLGAALNYFTVRSGLRGSETVGELSGDFELHPYNETTVDETGLNIKGRTLVVRPGNLIKKFSPNSVMSTIYGSPVVQGDGLKDVPITVKVLAFMMAKIGRGIGRHLFDAKYDAAGTTTATCFDGIDTITAADIAAGDLSTDNGNLYEFAEKITRDNAVDLIRDYVRAASDELLGFEDGSIDPLPGAGLNLILPRSVYNAYVDDYKQTTGNSPHYDRFNQLCLEGFPNIRFVPLSGKTGSQFMQLTSKGNLLYGCNLNPDADSIVVEKHEVYRLDLAVTTHIGTNYESISPERLLVGKMVTA